MKGIKMVVDSDGCLVKYEGEVSKVIIAPGVKKIGVEVFKDNEYIEEIVFPDGLEQIDACAFLGCKNLKGITLPGSTHFVGEYAFASCHNLKFFRGEGVVDVQEGVFDCCSRLEKVAMPKIKTIGFLTFRSCSELVISDGDLGASLEEVGAAAFDGCRFEGDFSFPSLDKIGANAFAFCQGLESLALSSGCQIGEEAFIGCESLRNVVGIESGEEMPTNGSIGRKAFAGCSSLEQVDVCASTIDYFAFSGCERLNTFNNSRSVEAIGEYAFSDCKALEKFPVEKLRHIGKGAFGSSGIKSFAFSDVSEVEESAFSNCTNLKSVYMPNVKKLLIKRLKGAHNLL